MLLDHFRIELTVTQLPNRATGRPNDAGIYYGDEPLNCETNAIQLRTEFPWDDQRKEH